MFTPYLATVADNFLGTSVLGHEDYAMYVARLARAISRDNEVIVRLEDGTACCRIQWGEVTELI